MRTTRLILAVLCSAGLAATAAPSREATSTATALGGHLPLSVAAIEEQHAQIFRETDVDGDGLVSLEEFEAARPNYFGARPIGLPHRGIAIHRADPVLSDHSIAFISADPDSTLPAMHGEVINVEVAQIEAMPLESMRGKAVHGMVTHLRAVHDEAMQESLFDELDSDADGQISRAEFTADNRQAARAKVAKQRAFSYLDRDDDGVLTTDEFPPRHLLELDTDGDGLITREEMRDGRHRAG